MQACLLAMLPHAEVTLYHSWNIGASYDDAELFKQHLGQFDLVLAHRFYNIAHIAFDELKSLSQFIEFPVVNFLAFHPDCVYLVDDISKRIVRSALGDYNSAIVAYSYMKEIPAEVCKNAFREDIFRTVGYLSNWETAVSALDAEFKRCGFSVNAYLAKWMARKPFMHSINHPRISIVYDILGTALDRAKITYRAVPNIDDLVIDPLMNFAGWPLYPQIGRSFGFGGNYLFKGNVPADGARYIFSLDEFIESSYKYYADAGVNKFTNNVFQAWDTLNVMELISA
ncbi:WcbI family polysaccharide biosynthesis putative acetyltransferase (plasmid) [Rhizobium sp. WW22]|nr:hypothetical protein [Rhizobium sp. BK098]MBB3614926.1 hypothetical protein [Rhizobium sp. BK609]MBB3680586.1 hypothetical protein [Rhizobium sp. BK612]